MTVKPIPDGYHTITPYLVIKGADQLIEFLKKTFNAYEIHRTTLADGTLMHAEVRIGDSPVMVAEARGASKPMPSMFYLYVHDTDAVYKRAIEAGATSIKEPSDQFYGDRNAGVIDVSGNQWWMATHIEDVSPEELQKRAAASHYEAGATNKG